MKYLKKNRAISFFKLEEINKRFKIIKKGYKILELGSYPGGWSKFILKKRDIKLVSIDKKKIKKIKNKNFIFLNLNIYKKKTITIIKKIYKKFDLIISDACINISGIKIIDKEKYISLIKKIKIIESKLLKKGKILVFKILIENLEKKILKIFKNFSRIKFIRLKNKKTKSSETYILCKNKNE